jgi:hypothetical protein
MPRIPGLPDFAGTAAAADELPLYDTSADRTYGATLGQLADFFVAYVDLPGGDGGDFTSPPSDGTYYAQYNAAWTAVPIQADAASDGTYYARCNAGWTALSAAYDVSFDFGASTILTTATQSVVIARASSIPNNFDSSVAFVGTNPTSSAVFTVKKTASGVTTTIGTVTISTGGTITFAFSSPGSAHSIAAGTRLFIEPPNPADGTLAGVSITIAMTRT